MGFGEMAREYTILVIIDKTIIENLSKTDYSLKKILVKNILSGLKNKSESIEQTANEKTKDLSQLIKSVIFCKIGKKKKVSRYYHL